MTVGRIVSGIFFGAMAVLIIMNGNEFAAVVKSVGSAVFNETKALSGSGYIKAK